MKIEREKENLEKEVNRNMEDKKRRREIEG